MNDGEERTQRWHGHPIAARLIRVAIFVVPFMTAMVVAFLLSTRLPVSSSLPISVLRWMSIVAIATVAMAGVDRVARRFLPLSVLLRLTLVFPDQAPSRFAVAMRTGTTAQLKRRLEAAREVPVDETPQQAAERLLELVALLSHHDRLTRGHSERVRAYSHLIGEEMGLTESELDKLRWAGLLHDVGKTAISTDILNKPGKLTAEEYEAIKSHPDEGRALVAPLAEWLGESVRAVWEHHERFDGNGYPRGLSGTDISFAARVVSVADSYDVMTSARSYKKPMSAEAARAELATCSGTQFDPIVVRSFLNVSLGRLRLMTGPLAWLAQLALLEPSGVVHAGSSSLESGASGTTGGTTGSTGAATAGAAASTGSAGVMSTVAATAASVVVSTAGIVAAAPPMMQRTDTVAVVQTAAEGADMGDLALPAQTVVVIDSDGGPARVESSSPVPDQQTAEFVFGTDDDGAPSEPADDPVVDLEPTGVAADDDTGTPARPAPTSTDAGPTETRTKTGATTTDSPTTTGATTTDAPTTTDTPTTDAPPPDSSSTTTTAAPATPTTTTTAAPATPTTTTTAATTTTTTTTTAAPTTTTTTTTTTVAPPPAPPPPPPPTTTTTTTTTTTVPVGPIGSLFHLGGDVTSSTSAPWFHNLVTSSPPDIALPNFDTDRDAFPGVVIAKDSAGIGGTDPTKVLRFSGGFLSSLDIDGDVHVELFAAAKDFARKDIDVEVGVYKCSALSGCRLIDSGVEEYKSADKWRKKKFHFHGVDESILIGQWLEVRVAVLDSSQDDGWFAFGTADYDSNISVND